MTRLVRLSLLLLCLAVPVAASVSSTITVTVTADQLDVLRARWPNAQQIGLPAGVPTDTQLVQAYLDYGLSGDVARHRAEKQATKLKTLTPTQCAVLAKALSVAVDDLPCGGGL